MRQASEKRKQDENDECLALSCFLNWMKNKKNVGFSCGTICGINRLKRSQLKILMSGSHLKKNLFYLLQ